MLKFPYTSIELTQEVNRIPNTYGMLNELNLFPSEGLGTRIVEITFKDGELVVLAADEPGQPGQMNERETENSIFVKIPHFPMLDKIGPEDFQGLLEVLNGTRVPKSFDRELAKRLQNIRLNHAITREFVRIGAMKGLIQDGKARTLYNLFTVFGIVKKVVHFDLGNANSDIAGKCNEIFDYYAENLKGETMSGVLATVSKEFFSKLIVHPKVEKFWQQTEGFRAMSNIPRGPYGRTFEFGNITFREYIGYFPLRQADGSKVSARAIDAEKGHVVPTGTTNAMRTFDGPVHHIDHVNEAPEGEVFISEKVLDHGRGVELNSQSNVLPICKRPELLIEIDTAAAA